MPRWVLYLEVEGMHLAAAPGTEPCALARGAVIADASAEAWARGVRRGQSVRTARSLCPGLAVAPLDPARTEGLQGRLLAHCATLSPLVEPTGTGMALIELAGGPSPPTASVTALTRLCLPALGHTLRAGLAASPLVARAAVWAGVSVVPPGGEAAFLAPLPLALLGYGDMTERLQALGLRTAGEVAAVPERELFRLFGAKGPRLATHCRGEDATPVAALYPPPSLTVRRTSLAITDIMQLKALLAEVAADLSASLARQCLASGRLGLALECAGDPSPATGGERAAYAAHSRRAERAYAPPRAEPASLRGGLEFLLTRCRPASPLVALTVTADRLVPVPFTQLDLFKSPSSSDGPAAETALAIRYGATQVCRGKSFPAFRREAMLALYDPFRRRRSGR